MSSSILYKNLFEVRILHHYFLDSGEKSWNTMNPKERDKMELHYDIRDFLEITPTPECLKALIANKCVCKITSGGILVGIKAGHDDDNPGKFKPYKSPADDLSFSFLVRLRDMNFMNYTALPLQGREGKMFVFKNFSVSGPNAAASLTALPCKFDPSIKFMPGDMACDDQGNPAKLYTALVKTSADPEVPENAGDWLTETIDKKTPLNYANSGDLYPLVNSIFNYTMKVADVAPVATLRNSAGTILTPRMVILPGNNKTLQVDLQSYPQGFYTIHIEGNTPGYIDDVTFYLSGQPDVPFGLIEIRAKSDKPGFNLTGDGYLLSPVFQLRFRNRRTYWRYYGSFPGSPSVADQPAPLTWSGHIPVEQPFSPEKLPNPDGSLIVPEAITKPGEKKYYSDIHIN
jgi:hypothetical protein